MINKLEKCIGCGNCQLICKQHSIEMKYNIEGFRYPKVNLETCIQCGECNNVCPIGTKCVRDSRSFMKTYVAYSNEQATRKSSTSGGIFAVLSEMFLKSGGIVVGVAFDKNFNVGHICIHNISQLYRIQGSKYVQSDSTKSFYKIKQYLERGIKVLFSGTNCQIIALKKFLKKNYQNLYCVGIVCHGVAAPKIWKQYLHLFHAGKKIIKVNFRDKRKGWNKSQFSIAYDDGSEYCVDSWEDPYLFGFYDNIFLRQSCYQCEFKLDNNSSDIILGDAWGIEKFSPDIYNYTGNSLIIIQNNKGNDLLNKIKKVVTIKEISEKISLKYNKMVVQSARKSQDRKKFFVLYSINNFYALKLYKKIFRFFK